MTGLAMRTLGEEVRGRAPASAALLPTEAEALAFLNSMSDDYPNIEQWFIGRVVPGLRFGTRKLLRIERDRTLVGLGIAKNEPDEKKICTVRVMFPYTGRGIGIRIFDSLLSWLDCDRPHLTISETKLPAFERIFDHFGFEITSVTRGLYVPRNRELGYNEVGKLEHNTGA